MSDEFHHTSSSSANDLAHASVTRTPSIDGGEVIEPEDSLIQYMDLQAQTAKRYVHNGSPDPPNKPSKRHLGFVAVRGHAMAWT